MKNACTTLIVALFVPTLAQADDRLWGTWEGVDPVDEVTLILTFSEDGSFSMSSPDMTGDEFSFEELFEEMLSDMELSQDELNALGFEPPVIDRISIEGRWATQGDSLKVWVSNALVYIEGQPPLGMDELMVAVLTQIASLPLENEDLVDMLNLVIALIPLAFEEMLEEELLFEEIYYFLDGQLIITSAEGEPLVLSRLDGPPTAVREAAWGQIKARWPQSKSSWVADDTADKVLAGLEEGFDDPNERDDQKQSARRGSNVEIEFSVDADGLSATGTITINGARFDVAEFSAATAAPGQQVVQFNHGHADQRPQQANSDQRSTVLSGVSYGCWLPAAVNRSHIHTTKEMQMLRFIMAACLTAFVVPVPVFAHQEEDAPATGVEIGTLFGLSRFSAETSAETAYDREELTGKITLLGVPGGLVGPFGPSLYVSWFPSKHLAIGPEFSFGRMSFEGEYEYEDKYND